MDRFGGTGRRRDLIARMEVLLHDLALAGCATVYVGGSFVTAKQDPADYDICWDPVGVDPSLLDPVILKVHPPRLEQKLKYQADVFPADTREGMSGKVFLDFFQLDKQTGDRKGIVKLTLRRP